MKGRQMAEQNLGQDVRVLIVVDMQNDFIDGALGTAEACAIVDAVREKVELAVERGDRIVFTRDTHHEGYLDTNEGRHLPVEHCIEGTDGWQVRAELVPSDYDVEFVDKPNFGFTGWADMGFGDAEIELVGVCTDICVVSNALALKAIYPENRVVVDAACCAGVTPELHDAALVVMRSCQVDIVGA